MFYIASAPLEMKTRSVLHIVHPIHNDKGLFEEVKMKIQSTKTGMVRIGCDLMTLSFFEEYETIVLHAPPLKHIADFKDRLLKSHYLPSIKKAMKDPNKQVVFYRETCGILAPEVFIIPPQNNVVSNKLWKSEALDTRSKGLDLLPFTFVRITDPLNTDTGFNRTLKYESTNRDLYLLDKTAVYSSNNGVKFGNLYKLSKGKSSTIAVLPDSEVTSTMEEKAIKAREVPAMEEESSTDEQIKQTAGKAVAVKDSNHG